MSQAPHAASSSATVGAGRLKPKGVSLVSFNVRSLRANIPELREFVKDREVDMLLLQETWLKPSILKGLSIGRYALVRNDRTTPPLGYGGTAIYYRKSLHCTPIPTPALLGMEATVVRLGMTGHSSLYIVSVYIPSGKLPLKRDFEALLSLGDSVLMFGDFNSKHTDWTCASTNASGIQLMEITDSLELEVLVPLAPTHYPDNASHTPDLLDFALAKGVSLAMRSIETLDDLGSDHRPVSLVMGSSDPLSPPLPKTFTKWEGFKESMAAVMDAPDSPLAFSPDYFDSADKIDDAVESLTAHIKSALKANEWTVPDVKRQELPIDAQNLIKAKRAALRRAARYPTPEYRHAANRLQRLVRARLAELRDSQWGDLMETITPSHQAYYRVARALRTDAITHTPPLTRPDGTLAFEDAEKAECFADSIASQCSPSTQECDPAHVRAVEDEVLRRASLPLTSDPITTSPDEIHEFIKGLKANKAPGADGISNQALKHLPAQVLTLLAIIFNACFDLCHFPTAWKEAIVIGIPKPGKPLNVPSSHRPISLLKAMGKLLERIILSRMKEHLHSEGVLIPHQFGFRPKHSCPGQIHRIVEFILSGFFPLREKTVAVFYDVAKAFDKVWHGGLVFKLYKLDLSDRLVRLVASYLSNRTFRYRHEGILSSSRPLRAGVPQGSVLSPILYISYTNDIPTDVPGVGTHLFADDTALLAKSRMLKSALRKLQLAVNKLEAWFKLWRIEVNPEKSSAVCFDVKQRRPGNEPPPIRMQGKVVPWQRKVKYLGVTLDSRLTFRPHVDRVTSTARFYMNRLGSMLGRGSRMSLRNKLTLFKVCIRPVLTYASPVFAQASSNIIDKLQVVQNRFCRMATGAPYYVRNADLHRDMGLPTIQQLQKKFSETFFKAAEEHPNPLVREAATYTPRPPSLHMVRRPRHVLDDPPNKLSSDLNLLLEAQAGSAGSPSGPQPSPMAPSGPQPSVPAGPPSGDAAAPTPADV